MEREIDSMFGFELTTEPFDLWEGRKPKPPAGYVKFNSNRAHCQAGFCPNCRAEKPGRMGSGINNGGGFQDKRVMQLHRAMNRLDRYLWKRGIYRSFELFATNIQNSKTDSCMVKGHPSRFSTGEFMCCHAQIWHDFTGPQWDYYYKPTGTTLLADFKSNDIPISNVPIIKPSNKGTVTRLTNWR